MAKEHIYDNDPLYSFLRAVWTDGIIKACYRRTEIHGSENLPEDGAVILSPNHCNTLMDALVILRADKGPTVFGARADVFRKPLFAKIMYFLRILPMVRQRDGLRNVLQNNSTQEIVVDTLENGVPFCIYPEGTHRTMHSLQRLGKGIFRIAIAANARFGKKKPVYIVPAGIEYGDYFRYRSTSLVTYGKPINVTRFMEEGGFESEPQAIEALRSELSARMKELVTYIPDDENYPPKWTLIKMAARLHKGKGGSLHDAMMRNREIASGIADIMESDPERAASLLERVSRFEDRRLSGRISVYSFGKKHPLTNAIGKGIAALALFPYFVFCALTALPMWAVAFRIRSGVKDPAFRNTVSCAISLALGPVLTLIYAVLAFCLAPWWLALALVALWLHAYSFFHDYIEFCRRWFSDIRLLGKGELTREFDSIMADFKDLKR